MAHSSSSKIPSSSNNNEGQNDNRSEEKNSSSKSFLCKYCPSNFSSQQALAGHHNAHKKERAFEKQRKKRYDGETSGLGQPNFTLFNYSTSFPVPCTYRPLGVRLESMIRKSPCDSPNPMIGHGALSLRDILNPLNLRNNIEGGTNGVGVQGIGGETTSRIEDGAGNKFIDFLRVGESSNVADLNLKSNDEADSESSELDLTLKL